MQVRFDHSKEEAPGIVSLFFERLERTNHTAGQFIEVNLKHAQPDNRGIRRWFTLSSGPEEEFLSITTRFAGEKSSSFKQAFVALPKGTVLSFSPPEGDFILPSNPERPVLFVAGGIGITPFHSMTSHLLATKEQRSVTLLHGINTPEDNIFADTFSSYGANVTYIISKPAKNWQGETGMITADRIVETAKKLQDPLIYLSGPEPMVESLDKALRDKGIPRKQIKTDFFPGYEKI